ncbi:unnamed protein product [Lathyrus oleraceus]
MICKYFVRDSFRGFCLQILNSAVVIGLYYGFLTTIAIGPSLCLAYSSPGYGKRRVRDGNSSNNWVYYGTPDDLHIHLLYAFAFGIE